MTTRRNFIGGLAGIFAAGVAPAIGHAGILMPVRKIIVPKLTVGFDDEFMDHILYGVLRRGSIKFPGPITAAVTIGKGLIVSTAHAQWELTMETMGRIGRESAARIISQNEASE